MTQSSLGFAAMAVTTSAAKSVLGSSFSKPEPARNFAADPGQICFSVVQKCVNLHMLLPLALPQRHDFPFTITRPAAVRLPSPGAGCRICEPERRHGGLPDMNYD